ncbi:MAG: tetratricopeptide repeat protein [Planctomycetes bacterium]|nr:tetratricopeptide repeat protein [Planctomycetota bacterium]
MSQNRRIFLVGHWAGLLLPAVAAVITFLQVGGFGFLFDDNGALVHNGPLRQGDWWRAAFGDCTPLGNRPVASLSFALDFRLGLTPGGMHLANLGIHAINAVLVGLIVGRLLRCGALVAGLCAAVWAVHPLQVDAVAYLTQRIYLLMGTFVLLAVWSALRAAGSAHALRWQTLCVIATALAMATKEDAVGLSLLLLLLCRACSPSWSAVLVHWRFHALLACTWLVLAACVSLGPDKVHVGYATEPRASAFEWLLTQTQCITHYVRSVFVPDDLRGMYDFAVLRSFGPALVPGLLLLAALLATVVAIWRRPRWALAGAVFFLFLAPTSSVLPMVTEPCADRRMYLPLLAFVVPTTTLLMRLRHQLVLPVLLAATALLGYRTTLVAAHYADSDAFFAHAAASNDLTENSYQTGRILEARGRCLQERGDMAAAQAAIGRAMQCEAPGLSLQVAAASVLREQGALDEAGERLRELLLLHPGDHEIEGELARVLMDGTRGRSRPAAQTLLVEAERLLCDAVSQRPRQADYVNNLGVVLHMQGRTAEALPRIERALTLRPGYVEARRNLAVALIVLGQPDRALAELQPLLRSDPPDPVAPRLAAEARARLGGGR